MSTAYTLERFCSEAAPILRSLRRRRSLDTARRWLYARTTTQQFDSAHGPPGDPHVITVRDCARAVRGMLGERADTLAGFSLTQALWDIARGVPRPDLQPAFFAEMTHLLRGLQEQEDISYLIAEQDSAADLDGRAAAIARSLELDRFDTIMNAYMDRYEDGLQAVAVARRAARRQAVLEALGGRDEDWGDWTWQAANVLCKPDAVARAIALRPGEEAAMRAACDARLPFGVTPYYASLMDDDPAAGRDRAVRAQVLPPADYVAGMRAHRGDRGCAFDFMRESDTSPVDLVTRRYPGIVILKPFNTCPQICVYCQRNWEIEQPMAPDALASWEQIEAACAWIAARPAIREVLVTGGDPLALADEALFRILERVAAIAHVELIRIGTRTLVTMPMRITQRLAERLGRLRVPGRREFCIMTHVQHPYEITPELVGAVDRLRRQGIPVFNQLVYTFFVSRRFEAARLRLLLRVAGIEPYYTFVPKGKEETAAYRVPLARLLQEQKEEARLLPGTRRTDEAVYNVPGLGKNYLRATQNRDLLSIRADGARVYEFHPWEKNVAPRDSYVGADVPILEYLARLAGVGEDPEDYRSIWYYF